MYDELIYSCWELKNTFQNDRRCIIKKKKNKKILVHSLQFTVLRPRRQSAVNEYSMNKISKPQKENYLKKKKNNITHNRKIFDVFVDCSWCGWGGGSGTGENSHCRPTPGMSECVFEWKRERDEASIWNETLNARAALEQKRQDERAPLPARTVSMRVLGTSVGRRRPLSVVVGRMVLRVRRRRHAHSTSTHYIPPPDSPFTPDPRTTGRTISLSLACALSTRCSFLLRVAVTLFCYHH